MKAQFGDSEYMLSASVAWPEFARTWGFTGGATGRGLQWPIRGAHWLIMTPDMCHDGVTETAPDAAYDVQEPTMSGEQAPEEAGTVRGTDVAA